MRSRGGAAKEVARQRRRRRVAASWGALRATSAAVRARELAREMASVKVGPRSQVKVVPTSATRVVLRLVKVWTAEERREAAGRG